jgi:hypothetical protein
VIEPEPRVGWVLRYSYLWSDDSVSDSKDRPAVVVLAVRRAEGRTLVRVAPVTHREPVDSGSGVEIPPVTKQRLGLDPARSWIVLDHANEFVWPGPDLRPVPGKTPPTVYYGPLPPKLFNIVRRRLLSLIQARRLRSAFRTE